MNIFVSLLFLQNDALPLPWLPQKSPFQLAQCCRDEGWNLPELRWKAVTPLRKNAWHQGCRTPNQWHRQMSYLPIRWKRNIQFHITIHLFPRTSRDGKKTFLFFCEVNQLILGALKYLEHSENIRVHLKQVDPRIYRLLVQMLTPGNSEKIRVLLTRSRTYYLPICELGCWLEETRKNSECF